MLERPLHTERLTLRPATADDADPTWKFRRLESVNEWLTGCPADLDGYRELFSEPAGGAGRCRWRWSRSARSR